MHGRRKTDSSWQVSRARPHQTWAALTAASLRGKQEWFSIRMMGGARSRSAEADNGAVPIIACGNKDGDKQVGW